MDKNFELNSTAIVPTNSTLSTAVQQPAAPAPAESEMIETTFTDDKEQAPAAAPADEKKKPKKHRNVEHCKVDFDKKVKNHNQAKKSFHSLPSSYSFMK